MNLKNFIHLIRYKNLLIIALTMLTMQLGVVNPLLLKNETQPFCSMHLILLVASTLLIAASGYIINDYFDVKTDKINKPDKTYIDKGVKRRVAIIMHVFFNSLGILISAYLSYKKQNIWLLLFSVLAVVLLWFYSTHLKKQLAIGNVVVALLTALIPLQVLCLNIYPFIQKNGYPIPGTYLPSIIASVCFSIFAFLLSMVREIIKDIEDYEGDYATGCKTIPIVWGIKASKALIAGLISNTVLLLLFSFYKLYQLHFNMLSLYLFFCVLSPLFYLFFKLYKAQNKQHYGSISKWLKFIMISGILSTVLIYLSCYGYM
ncbi:MAG: geranylgeranylglycerol-phosphate geranylgeranyltransferase [Bacteroidetes bacterium]|nr:geranylgeranylglycerol-phosphate geranylgeranyltransferase [Bacteroidota bacterium]